MFTYLIIVSFACLVIAYIYKDKDLSEYKKKEDGNPYYNMADYYDDDEGSSSSCEEDFFFLDHWF